MPQLESIMLQKNVYSDYYVRFNFFSSLSSNKSIQRISHSIAFNFNLVVLFLKVKSSQWETIFSPSM